MVEDAFKNQIYTNIPPSPLDHLSHSLRTYEGLVTEASESLFIIIIIHHAKLNKYRFKYCTGQVLGSQEFQQPDDHKAATHPASLLRS